MINWRKILNIPDTEQKKIMSNEMGLIDQRCSVVAKTERNEQKETQRCSDNRCPRCRATHDKIVDRYAYVESKGRIGGNFFKLKGIVMIETKPVNHCNNCNHEWEKFKTKTITDMDVMKIILIYLSDIIKNPEISRRYKWKYEAIEVFENCHAETIMMICEKYKKNVNASFTLRQLRKKYESIYD